MQTQLHQNEHLNPKQSQLLGLSPTSPTSSTFTPEGCLDVITHLIPLLLLSLHLSVKSFPSKWHSIKTHLQSLSRHLSDLQSSSDSVDHPLLRDLFPRLLTSLESAHTFSRLCASDDPLPAGKLRTQSDLDIISASLADHARDLEVLVRSGVLHRNESTAAAVVVFFPGKSSRKEDVEFFVRDAFARLQVGGVDHKRKALASLIRLLEEDKKNCGVIAKEGDLGYLVRMLENPFPSIREQSAAVVSLMAESELCRRSLFSEGALGPLFKILDLDSPAGKESAATAIERITCDSDNAWAVTAYGGIGSLLAGLRSGMAVVQAGCTGALRNVSAVEEMRKTVAEEGAAPVLVELLLSGSTAATAEDAAECLSWLALSDEGARKEIVREGGVPAVLRVLGEPNATASPKAQETAARTMFGLSCTIATASALASTPASMSRLAQILRSSESGTILTLAASTIYNLSMAVIPEDGLRVLGETGCFAPLVKMIESKPTNAQEIAARVLCSLLVVSKNRRDFVKGDKSLSRLVQLLDPELPGVPKSLPVSVLLVLSTGRNIPKKIAAAGAVPHLQRLAEADVAGAGKLLRRVTGNRLRDIFTWR